MLQRLRERFRQRMIDDTTFGKLVYHRYSELRTSIEDVLLETLQNWDSSIGSDALWKHFTLESLSIPRLGDDDRRWELCYTLADDPHYFCVMFDMWIVEGVRVDG